MRAKGPAYFLRYIFVRITAKGWWITHDDRSGCSGTSWRPAPDNWRSRAGQLLEENVGLPVQKFLPGGHRGGQQVMARIACEEVDMLLFFRDPIAAKPSEPNEMNLLRICDVHNIPVATNIATAEVLIHGLEHGDLDWRTILHPSHA